MRTLDEAQGQFAYHPATPETAPMHEAVRGVFLNAVDDLWPLIPDGPEKTLALRKLQEAQMFANLAVALQAPAVEPGTHLIVREVPSRG
jgi:hypothetical protein